MQPVEIYTTPTCGYCHRAKRLLSEKGIGFSEIDVSDPKARAAMMERLPNARTVPQILIGGTPVGGSDDLYALERAGKLDALLGR